MPSLSTNGAGLRFVGTVIVFLFDAAKMRNVVYESRIWCDCMRVWHVRIGPMIGRGDANSTPGDPSQSKKATEQDEQNY